MHLNHIAICSKSKENADKFYINILGLNKEKEFVVNKGIAKKIFNRESDYSVAVYGNENFKVEVFFDKDYLPSENITSHICLELKDRDGLIKKCNHEGIFTLVLPKGESYYLFIRDYDSNLYEIKELTKM